MAFFNTRITRLIVEITDSKMVNRYEHVDIARGIAIILVVMGHSCSSSTGDLNRMILGFHMPLFFFLSGLFAKEYTHETLWRGVVKKMRRILLPQVLLSFTVIIMKGIPWVMNGNSIWDFDLLNCFGYWFLPTLFFVSVLYMTLSLFVNFGALRTKIITLFITLVMVGLTLYAIDIPNGFLSKYIKLVPVAFLFYFSGSCLKKYVILEKGNKFQGVLLLILAPLMYVITQWNTPVKMYLSDYGRFPLFLLSSFMGIILVSFGSKHIKNFGILRDFGEMSIAVYVWNFLVVAATKSISLRLLKMVGLYTTGAHAAITFLISICVLYAVCKISLKKLPVVYGIKNDATS